MSTPSISVVIPAYNAAEWIDETLDAVLGQTVRADEVVVVDDGSTDDTAAIVARRGAAVRLVRQDNGGAASAWNRGFAEAMYEFVAKCPADDLWQQHKLEWQLATLRQEPSIDLLFGGARDFGVVDGDLPRPAESGMLDPDRLLPALYASNCFAAPTAVVRRKLHEALGGFREDLVVGEDYDFWLRALAGKAVFYYDDRLMTKLRKHGDNLSLQALMTSRMNYRIHGDHADVIANPRLARTVLARDLRMAARCALGLGNARDARAAYFASLRQRWNLSAGAFTLVLSIPGAATVVDRLRPADR